MSIFDALTQARDAFNSGVGKVSSYFGNLTKDIEDFTTKYKTPADYVLSRPVPRVVVDNPLIPPGMRNEPTPTVGQYFFGPKMTEGGNVPTVRGTARTILEDVMPSMIGVTHLPTPTGWNLGRAALTTAGFSGLQKAAGYSDEDILNPVNLGMSFGLGGLTYGEPAPKTQAVPEITKVNVKQRLSALMNR